MHLRGNGLLETIDSSKTVSDEKKAKAMIFLRHHIHDGLKDEYITKDDPCDLLKSLKERFDHQKYVIFPKAKHEWIHLRFHDYKIVSEFNSAMFGITSRMMLCGEKISDYDMIEKTLSTFHLENVIMQQHYDNRKGQGRGRGGNRYHGRGRGRGRRLRPYDERDNKNFHENERNEKDRDDKKQTGKVCYRCGMKGHWVRSFRTPKHLADLYRESQKGKEKGRGETNFISDEPGPFFHGLNDDTHLDISDFLVEPESIDE
ncbi:PREDICTED: uncharacterized protein LOC106321133 [Brassica oleracea var. oleracea]|uniref:uncharacterized protein LOC106321133 n=1 Tax=Brassica oleracea var. oleracea TaxID=109376 RepID=UPI0006A70571|nr:PREDICTED: uncharacterized protein LOC106321133 [Brassica oleracea var. oleracea]